MTLRQACPPVKGGAMCVQRFDDSQCSAIHTTFRASLRSSSMREPRDPLLKVLIQISDSDTRRIPASRRRRSAEARIASTGLGLEGPSGPFSNDPSAGSPTETLLRLLLPLNDQV